MHDLDLRLLLSHIEDEALVKHLTGFKGHGRNKRVRHLLRTGLAFIQGDTLPPQDSTFPEPRPPSTSAPDQGEPLRVLSNPGLNEFSYAAPPKSVIRVVMLLAMILFFCFTLATWGTAYILVTYFAPLLLEQEVSLIYHIAFAACWSLIVLFGMGMLYLMFVRLKK
jgi:hypothetical protein